MKKSVMIKANNSEEAQKIGLKELQKITGRKIETGMLSVELIEEKKRFFGLKKGDKKYRVYINEKLSKREADFLDVTMETIKVDGRYKIQVTEEGILLKIIPPEGKGQEVRYLEVKEGLEKSGIVEVDWQLVQELVNQPKDEWKVIAPRKPELDRDAEVELEISKDKLKAFISYKPAYGGKKLSADDLKRLLEEKGIVYGIKNDQLEELIEERKETKRVLIAEGRPPEEGKDAELIYNFEQNKESVGTRREDGSMDFYNLGLINNVQAGELLVVKKDPEPGKPGKAITGEELSAPTPRDRKLPRGKNVEIKDEHNLVSKIAGQVVVEREKVHVLPIYEVRGDVDLSTGNIEFVGNVVVRGSVTEGFSVKADGNVEIRGHVSIADIEAGGDVVIYKGFIGKNKSQIKAGGDVRVRFVENGYISAGGTIYVSEAVMHSKLNAGEAIEIKEKKGLLVGGESRARSKIDTNIIGSSLATNTLVEAGIDPELKNRMKELNEEINQEEQNLLKARKAVEILERIKKQTGKLPEQKKIMYGQLQKTREELRNSVEEKEQELRYLKERANIRGAFVAAKKKVYPGARIVIGSSQLNVRNDMAQPVKFVEEDGEIRKVHVW
ncbi:MAG TPA: FapA family protein [Halanaerobiales bacterium]|nr:FapA family protein [Halanaerobiales bacterium]